MLLSIDTIITSLCVSLFLSRTDTMYRVLCCCCIAVGYQWNKRRLLKVRKRRFVSVQSHSITSVGISTGMSTSANVKSEPVLIEKESSPIDDIILHNATNEKWWMTEKLESWLALYKHLAQSFLLNSREELAAVLQNVNTLSRFWFIRIDTIWYLSRMSPLCNYHVSRSINNKYSMPFRHWATFKDYFILHNMWYSLSVSMFCQHGYFLLGLEPDATTNNPIHDSLFDGKVGLEFRSIFLLFGIPFQIDRHLLQFHIPNLPEFCHMRGNIIDSLRNGMDHQKRGSFALLVGLCASSCSLFPYGFGSIVVLLNPSHSHSGYWNHRLVDLYVFISITYGNANTYEYSRWSESANDCTTSIVDCWPDQS